MINEFTPKLFTLLKKGYKWPDLRGDLIAGFTVAIVALPLAMALAIASGASPEQGLLTSVIAGFLISFLGGSRVQIGGPTGAFVVVVFNVIASHGFDGLILASFMAGIILIAAGYARLGLVIKFIPLPVITGFTAGIAIIIASSQVKDFFGLDIAKMPADFISQWGIYAASMATINWAALLVGFISLVIILVLRKIAPKIPGYIIAIICAAGMVHVFDMPVDTIGSRFPDISAGFSWPQWPDFNFQKMQDVMPSALTIAFLAGIEALLSAVVADGMTGYKHRPNQELIGQGVANLASSIFGGLPATGAIARTATNIRSGGKTPMAGIFHAIFVCAFMLYAMDAVAFIPMASLAAILFVVAWGMSEFRHIIHISRISSEDRWVLILTCALTVLVDLTVAIGVGVILACLLFIRQITKSVAIKAPYKAFDRKYDENAQYNQMRDDLPAGVEVFQISGPFFFGVASNLLEALKSIGQMPHMLILQMDFVPYIDATGERALDSVIQYCDMNGTDIILCGLQGQPAQILKNITDKKDRKISVQIAKDYNDAIKTTIVSAS